MNPDNAIDLPIEVLHGYFEKMKKLQVCTLNKDDKLVPSLFFITLNKT